MLYRLTPGGQLQRRTHETGYPDLSLVKAREWAPTELRKAQAGRNPAAEHKAAEAQTSTHWPTSTSRSARNRHGNRDDDSRIRRVLIPAWGPRSVTAIRRADVRNLLDEIAARGAKTEANRTLALIRKMLNFALDAEWVEANVAAKLARPGGKEVSRARVLTADEIKQTWDHLHTPPPDGLPALDAAHWRLTRAALALRLVTAQRGKEVLSLRPVDIDGAWWTVPGTVAKNGHAHRVPLTAPARKILDTLTATKPDGYLFAGVRGTRQRRGGLTGLGIADVRPHDFRRTAASMMAAAGIPRLVVAKVLNHVSADAGVTAIYDRHGYDDEKRAALDGWAARSTRL